MSDTSENMKRRKTYKAKATDVDGGSTEKKEPGNAGGLAWIAVVFIILGGGILLYAVGQNPIKPERADVARARAGPRRRWRARQPAAP